MKRLLDWFLKYVSVINTFLLINILAIIIIDFGVYFTDRSIDILVAVAAIITTFFLFLAFRESKKANDFNISQPLFEEFNSQIEDLKFKLEEDLFGDFTIDYINLYVRNKLIKPHDLTFSKFILPLKNLYNEISKNDLYNQYMEKITLSDCVVLPDDEEIRDKLKSLTIIFNDIQISILSLYYNYLRILRLFKSIDQSILLKLQKQILFSRLDKISYEYELLSTIMKNNDDYYKQVICFNTFKVTSGKIITRFSIKFHERMLFIYEQIMLIKTEGNYELHSLEDSIDLKPN